MRSRFAVPVMVLALLFPALSSAATVADVTFDDQVTVGERPLQLNGVGIRKKMFIKVYLGALYLEQRSSDPAAILASDQARQVVMHFVYSEVEAAKLTAAWREGFANNSAAQLPALKERLETFCSWWPSMKSGQRAVVTYVPGAGTSLAIAGVDKGTIVGEDFARALWSVWLGEVPADSGLKAGMLGED